MQIFLSYVREPKHPINLMIGRRLAEVRHKRGFTQLAFAAALGVTKRTVQNWEHGRSAITIDLLLRMTEILDCRAEDLLAPVGSPLPPRHTKEVDE